MMRTAVVGLGWWGRYMVNALQGDSHLEVVAGMDVNLDAAQDLAKNSICRCLMTTSRCWMIRTSMR